jgi:uncharacterized protein (TIGR03067 family)
MNEITILDRSLAVLSQGKMLVKHSICHDAKQVLLIAGLIIAGMAGTATGDEQKPAIEANVDGHWRLTRYIEDGKPNDAEVQANYRVVRKNGVQEIFRDGKPFSQRKFEIDAEQSPKHIDFIDDCGARVRGIYQIKGDEMRVAILADPDRRKQELPRDLTEDDNILAVYDRIKEEPANDRDLTPQEASGRAGDLVTVRMVVRSVLPVPPDATFIRLVSEASFTDEMAFVMQLSDVVVTKLNLENPEQALRGKTIRATGKVQPIVFSSTPENRPGIVVDDSAQLEIIELR